MPNYIHIPTLVEGRASGLYPTIINFVSPPDNLDDWAEFVMPEIPDEELYLVDMVPSETTPVTVSFEAKLRAPGEVRTILKRRAKAKYNEVLNVGFNLPDGTPIGSDFEDRGFISAMETKLSIDTTIESIDYKLGAGWITIDRAMALGVYQLMLGHVAACDGKLQALNSQLDNATTSAQLVEVFNTGIDTGWPTYE